jgi:uncharacterized protein YcbX
MPPAVSELWVYPIKSCRGLSTRRAMVEERGFQWDRRWMLIDEGGSFLSQRKLPQMARIEVQIESGMLRVHAPRMEALDISQMPVPASLVKTTIWRDTLRAEVYPPQVNEWFRDFLGVKCSLVRFPDQERRVVDPRYAHDGEHTGFSDAYPFLVISEASLADLNSRLLRPVPMNRFRPNIVIRDCEPYAEDGWGEFTISTVRFRTAKPCARCRVITVDQKTAAVDDEPLRALGLYRSQGSKVLFGQNLLHAGSGLIAVGDILQIEQQGNQ